MLDLSLEEESLDNSDDDFILILAVVAANRRRDLHGNKGFYENILLAWRTTSGWLEGPLNLHAEKYKPQGELLNNTRLEGHQFPLMSKF